MQTYSRLLSHVTFLLSHISWLMCPACLTSLAPFSFLLSLVSCLLYLVYCCLLSLIFCLLSPGPFLPFVSCLLFKASCLTSPVLPFLICPCRRGGAKKGAQVPSMANNGFFLATPHLSKDGKDWENWSRSQFCVNHACFVIWCAVHSVSCVLCKIRAPHSPYYRVFATVAMASDH